MKIETNLIKIQPDHPVFRYEPVKNLLNKRQSDKIFMDCNEEFKIMKFKKLYE